MGKTRYVRGLLALVLLAAAASCGSRPSPASPDPGPNPGGAPIANVYILPGAVQLAGFAFGDEPLVIYTGETLRLRNLDGETHNVIADTPAVPEFAPTGLLAPGAEKSYAMRTPGTTTIHCTIHPQMTGTLVVRAR